VIITDLVWKDYVNACYRRINGAEPLWPWRETTTTTLTIAAETRSATLPTDVFRVVSAFNSTNKSKLTPTEGIAEHLFQWASQTEDGVPVQYRVFNNQFQVYPLPTILTTFTIEYLVRPADLGADGDIPVFPSEYHDLLVEGALADAYLDDGNLKQQVAHEARYKEQFMQMREDVLSERTERYSEITDNFY